MELTEAVGVDRRTVVRWRLWWREDFSASAFWQMARCGPQHNVVSKELVTGDQGLDKRVSTAKGC
jgi:hypothetical protein